MAERRERIPADEITDPKNWNLPFWTEPASVVKAREKEEETETLVEEQEIEIEPLTADQLEQIRQEAYNEGLQQGLVEGRQKGEKLGHDAGHKDGLIQGQEEGHKLGLEAGTELGKTQALHAGKKQTDETVRQLKSAVVSLGTQFDDQKKSIDELLPELVIMLSSAVVSQELDQGSEHIVALVKAALDALPMGVSQYTIEVNALDLPFLEVAFEGTKLSECLIKNDTVQAGGCQVLSQYSTVDFNLSERWKSILISYERQLQLGLLDAQSNAENEPNDPPVSEFSEAQASPQSVPTQEEPATQPGPKASAERQEPLADKETLADKEPLATTEQAPPTNTDHSQSEPSDQHE